MILLKENKIIAIRKLASSAMMLLLSACIIICAISCEDFVEVEPPASQLSAHAVFDDKTTADAAVAAIYARMRDNGMLSGNSLSITVKMAAYADELDFFGSGGNSTAPFFNTTLLPVNNEINNWWKQAYNQVYMCNAAIEGISASTAIPQPDKDRLLGEAYFARGVLHFYLANLFGDVPYVTTTDFQQNAVISKLPVTAIYANVEADLLTASDYLPEEYKDATRSRPNKYAAMAILSRVYLYWERWAEASDAASFVLNNETLYTWTADLGTVFLKDSPTTVWQFVPPLEGRNTPEGGAFIFFAGPPTEIALDDNLVEAFDPADIRKSTWIKALTNGTSTWHHPFKYKEKNPTATSLEFSIQLRTAELYLIRSEARARQGELVHALEDLNRIRNTAGLPDTAAQTQEDILEAILQERRFELFTEGGHRFFDLKRAGRLDDVLGTAKPGWDTTDRLLPLPETELVLNPNLLPQNPGY